jgi:adenine/guanine phosphoribosyltransferase-like PRPP-binding protein
MIKDCFNINPLESLIFFMAALIHDIGMQMKNWPLRKSEEKDFIEFFNHICPKKIRSRSSYKPDFVKTYHGKLGNSLLELCLNETIKGFYFPFFQRDASAILTHTKKIAFAHQDDDLLKAMLADIERNRKINIGDFTLEPFKLIGLLKLCDEIAGDSDRIQTEYIDRKNLTADEMKRWAVYYFVRPPRINIEERKISIGLEWEIPETINNKGLELIRSFILKMRVNPIKCATFFLYDLNSYVGIDLPRCDIEISLSKKPYTISKKIVPEVITIVKKKNDIFFTTSFAEIVNDLPEREKSFLSQDSLPNYNFSLSNEVYNANGDIKSFLRNWFDENKKFGHFELLTQKKHTDTYLDCRSLVFNQSFLDELTIKILRIINCKHLDTIIAIGTSAIPIAENIAARSWSPISFTFSPKKKFPEESEITNFYGAYEFSPRMYSNNPMPRVLIIDDIIANGQVVKDTLELFPDECRSAILYYFALFKLGSLSRQDYDKRIPTRNYHWLMEVPEVNYWDPIKEKCSLCIKNAPITYESQK